MDDEDRFAERVLAAGAATAEQVREARRIQEALAQIGERESLPLVMVRLGILTTARAREILKAEPSSEDESGGK
jgi:hypothetical protein